MSRKRDRRRARRIVAVPEPEPPGTVQEHVRADTLELAMQAVADGALSYTEYCLLDLQLYPVSVWDDST